MIDSMITKKRVRQIVELLQVERQKILQGPLTDLTPLVEKREKLIATLVANADALSKTDLELIKFEATQNQRLLDASIAGVREARSEINAQRRASQSMGTYTSDGQRMEVRGGVDLSDRRA